MVRKRKVGWRGHVAKGERNPGQRHIIIIIIIIVVIIIIIIIIIIFIIIIIIIITIDTCLSSYLLKALYNKKGKITVLKNKIH